MSQMFHMLTCFKLADENKIDAFQCALKSYANHMQEQGLLASLGPIGVRQTDTILDTDNERDHTHFFIMSFDDRAQSDAAVAYIERAREPAHTLHTSAYAHVVAPIFICWEDL